ncbi:DUF2264 domain-containing protein [Aspergillus undulatus]|uniref:DUF2264 domain-containing protein n=1 Tax=Aspergillus undulatus TaxID=1810928 RepID=UPI003CCDB555
MPPLSGFSNNPFKTRSDLVQAATALLSALEPYRSKSRARIKVPVATAAGFDEAAAQLEGFARPLWAVPFLFGETANKRLHLDRWVYGLQAGADPDRREYWGDLGDFDQRMVEQESIAIALLAAPEVFLGALSDSARRNLINWLSQINDHKMPQNNWLWFRVFVNLALIKSLGQPREELEDQIAADLNKLDTFDIGEGWSSDGPWGDERKQADYYSGSFAIQFAQLLYVRFAGDNGPRTEKYRQSARDFASVFWRYFGPDGAAIPFGRSMTYRFAFAGFWSAAVCANVELPEPLSNLGAVKGLILRHLRWWSAHPDIFNIDGTLNIGYTYPNMYMSENYNSPQSSYWCLKTFVLLMLPKAHRFWSVPELPHPSVSMLGSSLREIACVWPPRHILCNSPEHHFLLSAGQMTKKAHKAREAKYGKFAYSSAFGFSVPCGPLFEQMAADSTLIVSGDGGDTWKVRSEPVNEEIVEVQVSKLSADTVPGLSSIWRPWRHIDWTITTTLIPLVEKYPGWHLRVHKIKTSLINAQHLFPDGIQLIDAGFAIDGETTCGGLIPEVQSSCGSVKGYCAKHHGSFIKSRAGATGILDMTKQSKIEGNDPEAKIGSRSFCLRADPNTNLMAARTFIPCVEHGIFHRPSDTENEEGGSMDEIWLVSGVFAVSASAGLGHQTVHNMWLTRPQLSIELVCDNVEITVK